MTDKCLLKMAQETSESTRLFSHGGKKAQELLSVAIFLDLSGVNFDASQLRSDSGEPPDVTFQASQEQQCCNFEVIERLDPDTKRHGPYRDDEEKIRKAIMEGKSYADYI
jgi:hypothetical protein